MERDDLEEMDGVDDLINDDSEHTEFNPNRDLPLANLNINEDSESEVVRLENCCFWIFLLD